MSTAAPPQVNGRPRPAALSESGEWRPVEQDAPIEPPAPAVDHVALAEAAAIRDRAAAETEARRLKAEAEAKAAVILAEENARKLRLANDKAERRAKEEQAASEARIAESKRKKDEADRAAQQARKAEEAEQQTADKAAKEVAAADAKWRTYAIRFAIVCGIVALPVQIAAFWNPEAWWLVAAPVMLEGGSWVVQRGAAAAVANRRPLWHYRTIAWLLAFVAAGINLWHGWLAFDPATAIATAFASVAGPGVWDLHEHGRIRKRDGALTRRERNAKEKAAGDEAALRAAEEERKRAEKQAAEDATEAAAMELDADREEHFPKVWEHALKLAADLGESRVTESIWKRAKLDVDGALPGESAEVLRMRNAAETRVEAARQKKPVSTVSKNMNSQRANQMPRTQRGPARKPPLRRRGDTAPYVSAARKQAAIAAKNAAPEEQK
ncbi:hypothetical protein [Streptomyces niveus]|uniref:hypothetical protein n=1 Tax=Streptomyces niveus TaxID=193462 RepID=UPI0034326D55